MISGRIAADDMQGMRVNMLADGLFDLFCWVLTIVALILLFREAKRRAVPQAKRYTGWILVGAGLFNLVEGILDHELLGLHHVHPQSHWLAWDIGFLIVGGLLPLAIGWMLREEQQTKVIPMRPAA